MAFDLYQLDRIPGWDEGADLLEAYIDALIEHFLASPEGRSLEVAGFEPGYWIGQFVRAGYVDLRATLPTISAHDAEALLREVFPRKLGRHAPNPERAIPELLAFWDYLGRRWGLQQATTVLRVLTALTSEFPDLLAQGDARSLQELAAEAAPSEVQQTQALIDAYHESQALPDSFLAAMKSAAAAPPDLASLFGGKPVDAGSMEIEIDLSELELDHSRKRRGKRKR